MAHLWYENCAKCGNRHMKRDMRRIYESEDAYRPPKIICFLCQSCFENLLEELEIAER